MPSLTPLPFFHNPDPQLTLQFYQDVISSTVFCCPVSYLDKYPNQTISNYSVVLQSQSLVRALVREVVVGNAEKLGEIRQVVGGYLQKHNEIQEHQHQSQHTQSHAQQRQQHLINTTTSISLAIFNRLQQIKTLHLLSSITLGSLHLIDVNWKISKTISSSAKSFTSQLKFPYVFALTLYLREGKGEVRKVGLEMNKVQLKVFLEKLRALRAEVARG